MAATAGQAIRDERRRRKWTVGALALRAGMSAAHVAQLESGKPASLESYARIATALDLRPDLELVDPRRRGGNARPAEDFVHAAMGEIQAQRLGSFGFEVAIDEPYQDYQFAGRADLVAWDRADRVLLHVENRTRFPNVQEALGSYGAKRTYLGNVLAQRLGVRGRWASETHVVAALWTSEVLQVLRLRRTTFQVTCPDTIDAFRSWWNGDIRSLPRATSALVIFDPAGGAREPYRFTALRDGIRPRYRGYADAAQALR